MEQSPLGSPNSWEMTGLAVNFWLSLLCFQGRESTFTLSNSVAIQVKMAFTDTTSLGWFRSWKNQTISQARNQKFTSQIKTSMDDLTVNSLYNHMQDGSISSCLGNMVQHTCTDATNIHQKLPSMFTAAAHCSGALCDPVTNLRYRWGNTVWEVDDAETNKQTPSSEKSHERNLSQASMSAWAECQLWWDF